MENKNFKYEADILLSLYKDKYLSQRMLSKRTSYSLGIVNKMLKSLLEKGYIDKDKFLTKKGFNLLNNNKVKRAIILAAGFGMRMVPVNTVSPKALIKVHGEYLIERIIRQLKERNIDDIIIVVGFMKEEFDYLIDKYNVKLIVNDSYIDKNNLHSLYLLRDYLDNSYIIPSDIYISNNIFSEIELYSWYMVSSSLSMDSMVRVTKTHELYISNDLKSNNRMIGIAYLNKNDAKKVREKLITYEQNYKYDNSFWEETLYDDKNKKMIVSAKVVSKDLVYEINTYEELRELDLNSTTLESDVIKKIAEIFKVDTTEIKDIDVLKKGMTNRSFIFSIKNQKYIMRIPGEGTDKLIDRHNEKKVYDAIKGRNLCDNPIYLNADNGYKITKYLDDVRVCDKDNIEDLKLCMEKLRELHNMNLSVEHTFSLWKEIDFYEKLWNGSNSIYRDYKTTKENIFSLKNYIDSLDKTITLTHIDAVYDNFLFYKEDGKEKLQLTDWEYAGMQDKDVDIAMFCIYAMYDKEECDNIIDIYFLGKCKEETRTKIYAYIAICGLLWSNWCEYKRSLGVEFSEYGMKQYRYAKDFYRYCMERIR